VDGEQVVDIDGVLVGLVGGIGVSGFQWWLAREDRKQQRERMALEIKQLAESVRDTSESIRQRLPGAEEYVFYRSSATSPADDFRDGASGGAWRGGAAGSWRFGDGVLVFDRLNEVGEMWVRLNRYRFEKAHADVISGLQPGATRTIRVACEARAIGGHHTIVFALKSPGDPDGVHLGTDQRLRIRDDEFLYFEKWFTYPAEKDAYLRIIERSPSPAGSSVELRNITVSARVGAAA